MNNIKKDAINRALNQEIVLTKFLDLEELKEIESLKDPQVKVLLEGGYPDAERKRAIICLKDEEINYHDFKIQAYEIILSADFKTITHRQILGTLMSLGINRNSFGDILISENHYYLFVSNEITRYIEQNFLMINHISITLSPIDELTQIIESKTAEKNINVSSMRLDAIIARGMNTSRTDSEKIIKKGLVMINHKECLNTSYTVKINDIISIRHYGRIEVLEMIKTTKKDRLIIKVGIKH